MPLEIRTQRDGSFRPNWYGRYNLNGRPIRLNLQIKIDGTPPATGSLRELGDLAFEKSRAVAQAKLNEIIEEARLRSGSIRLVEKIYEIKTGETIRTIKLENLPQEWLKIARRSQLDSRYAEQCQSTLNRFVSFVQRENSKIYELGQVTRSQAHSFLAKESARNITAKTWNDILKLLRAAFKHLIPTGAINPFDQIPTRETDTVFRRPFTPTELGSILNVAQNDSFILPIILTGMCTAMRRGDCCLLDWKDVDLKKGFITVKTSKTGQTVSIPIFPMLEDALRKRSTNAGSEREGYVFPEQAQMYLNNPDGITIRVKKILALALGESDPAEGSKKSIQNLSLAEVRKLGETYLTKLPEGEKRDRMLKVFRLYMDGKNIQQVMLEAQVSKGSVSGYLNQIEEAIQARIMRGISHTKQRENTNVETELNIEREYGIRKASLRDFHSFRVTWVTIALTAGVPMELVQKVTGHKTADIVLRHYFQPGQEAFRSALNKAMPALLMKSNSVQSGLIDSKAEIIKIAEGMTSKTWKKDAVRIVKLAKQFGA
jgi:integrase